VRSALLSVGFVLAACSSAPPPPVAPPPPREQGPSLQASFTPAAESNLDADYLDTDDVELLEDIDGMTIEATAEGACRPRLTLWFEEATPSGTYALASDSAPATMQLEERCGDGAVRRWVANDGFVAVDQRHDGLVFQVDAWMVPDHGEARGKLHAQATGAGIRF
jgi:hypothetical protein